MLEDMLILAHREEASGIVNVQLNTYQINVCQGVCCNEILINHKRSGNAIICRKCHNQKRSQKRSEKRRTDCFHEQVSADSKTPISALTDEQKHIRFANRRKVKKEHIRKINKLEQSLKNVKHKIESLAVSLDGSDGTGFLHTENERPTENEKLIGQDDEGGNTIVSWQS